MICCDRFFIFLSLATLAAPTLSQNRTILCPALNLPPLSKGGGLTASHKLLHYCVCLRYAYPFYIANFSAVKTEGLLHQLYAQHQPFQNRTIPLALHHHPCHMNVLLALRPCKAFGRSTSGIHARPLSKVRCCRPKKFGRLPEGLLHQLNAQHQPFQNPYYPSKIANTLASLVKGRWLDG